MFEDEVVIFVVSGVLGVGWGVDVVVSREYAWKESTYKIHRHNASCKGCGNSSTVVFYTQNRHGSKCDNMYVIYVNWYNV